ncbi:enoyl-CoA hydratase/isomerase family protein [Ruegeria pomeroyi]|uniref:Enoyl-CoA hydratase-related protein n=1 Tax=Ruegeria alba TaxID=2916756 RepID=A0ABS9NS81_9RHOB|nr:enoyl-CoA hydratase-related protein [Ruegeria alba]MCE8511130.1 enoyl-CoA hydratase/isomerase family protein [Ruegeria pomeroyi]MCE8528229.1 enoyl-CoA hydratase/isomerase family protein [Ruegeria pomeroyi]MCG6556592.1 enoyl-CoA hydratase-related protein [Ruegeria alba]
MIEMPQEPLVGRTLEAGVLTLTLGRAPAHPLSRAMIEALHETVRRAMADDRVHVMVIHGPGRIFCAGHDLKEIARHRADPDEGRAFVTDLFEACSALMLDLARCPKPTIAMVEGIATAAGLQLMAACDLAYASPAARFCLPGVQNGGFCTTPAVAVSRVIGRRAVTEMALSGATYDADWALAAGLINRILPEAALAAHVADLAGTLAARNQAPLRRGLETLDRHLDLPLEEAYALATPVMVEHFMDPGRRHLDWTD